MFQMLGVFAEFERAIIRERVVAGMARAKANGTKSGKPIGRPAIHPARRAAICAAYEADGVGLRAVAAQLGVGVETVRSCVGERERGGLQLLGVTVLAGGRGSNVGQGTDHGRHCPRPGSGADRGQIL